MRKLFGTDGIRGVANEHPLTTDICKKLAKAIAKKIKITSKEPMVIIGKDTRISGSIFEYAIASELASYGINVELLGIAPTPAVSIITNHIKADMGIVISASHNPYYDNGIKLFNQSGLKLKDAEEIELESIMFDKYDICYATHGKVGRIQYNHRLLDIYTDKIKNSFSLPKSNIKIVLDSSNGALSGIASAIFESFGLNIVSIFDQPNGININEFCGVTNPKAISNAVKVHNADLGIAFDGDGDRIILSDESGNIIDGNQILAVLANWKPGNEVVSTIMANFGLEKYLLKRNIKLTKTNVGDRYISEYMQQNDLTEFGGEPSGHIIIKSHALTGDALYAALAITNLLIKSRKQSSEFLNVFKPFPSISNNVLVKNKLILENTKITETINNCKKSLGDNGKLIVRMSGTEPLVRISAEGEQIDLLQKIVDIVSDVIRIEESC